VAVAHVGPGPREGLCPPTHHRPQQRRGPRGPHFQGQPGFRSRFGQEFPTLPCCRAGWFWGCQDPRAPPAHRPAVPQPPPQCQGGWQSLRRGPGTPGCCGEVAATPSSPSGPHLLGVFAPCASQALPGSTVSSRGSTASRHRAGGTCSPTSSLFGGGTPQKPSALATDGPARGTGGRAARLDPLPEMKPRHHLLRLLITRAAGGDTAMDGWEWGDSRRRGQGWLRAPRTPACEHPVPQHPPVPTAPDPRLLPCSQPTRRWHGGRWVPEAGGCPGWVSRWDPKAPLVPEGGRVVPWVAGRKRTEGDPRALGWGAAIPRRGGSGGRGGGG